MVRRVCIGHLPDGNEGMWVSAPDVDVMAVANPLDGNLLTFNSNWTDIVQVHAIGKGSYGPGFPTKVLWPSLGYKPFLEVRVWDGGGRVYDDSFLSTAIGTGAVIQLDGFIPTNQIASSPVFGFTYVAYKIPVPVQ